MDKTQEEMKQAWEQGLMRSMKMVIEAMIEEIKKADPATFTGKSIGSTLNLADNVEFQHRRYTMTLSLKQIKYEDLL